MLRYAHLELRVEQEKQLPPEAELVAWIAKELSGSGRSQSNQEVGWVLSFDSGELVYALTEVARGTARALPLHMPTIMSTALLSGCDRFLFIHSHPGLDPTPSVADLDVTDQIQEAAAILGLYFEDHLIVTLDPTRYTSLRETGLYVPPQHIETEAARYGSPHV